MFPYILPPSASNSREITQSNFRQNCAEVTA